MLYTGKGDKGTTSTFTGTMSKNSALGEALGTLDELNSYVGFVKVKARESGFLVGEGKKGKPFADLIDEVQQNLFIIQAEVAGAPKKILKPKLTKTEMVIGMIEAELPPIRTFSVPGGSELSAFLDVARTLARRAERRVVAVSESGERKIGPCTLAYLNRLSSLLFGLARLTNQKYGIKDASPTYK